MPTPAENLRLWENQQGRCPVKRYEVELVVDCGGEPEEDQRVTKVVEASDKRAAVEQARERVRDENPEVDHRKIWAWFTRRLYT
jgi:hypothetical protein